jgi:multiple sugar transport system substrate-binding protein
MMVAREDLVYCPLVYCYATYAETDIRQPLRFFDMPSVFGPKPEGSTIGGAGIGISVHCQNRAAAFAYVRYLAEATTQMAFAANHGQPARKEAWQDAAINGRFANCFASTRATIDTSWIRPRYSGYLQFQAAGGELVEKHLRGQVDADTLLDLLSRLHSSAVAAE